jgi:hypothetical protein
LDSTGTAIVFDTTIARRAWTRMALEKMTNPYGDSEFATNAITFRAEERITIGVIRPTAINVVTGCHPWTPLIPGGGATRHGHILTPEPKAAWTYLRPTPAFRPILAWSR